MRPRKLIATMMVLALLGAEAEAQEVPGPDGVVSTSYTDKNVVSGPRVVRTRDFADAREFAMLGRIQLDVPVGTRWQVERPLQDNRLLFVLSPAPPNLIAQLQPYRHLDGLKVLLDRSTTKMAVIGIEADATPAPLYVDVKAGGHDLDRGHQLMMGTSQWGTVERAGGLTIHLGRLRRYSPWQEFCRLARTPLGVSLEASDPNLEQFNRAEALFSHGEDLGANEIYADIAEKLRPQGFSGTRQITVSFRQFTASELASFRLADVSLCEGQVRSARLRYDVLYHRPERTALEIVAGLSWIQLAYPDVDHGEAEALARSLSRTDKSPLAPRAIIHAARVKLLLDHPQEALTDVRSLDGSAGGEPYRSVAQEIKLRALAALVGQKLEAHDDIGLVSSVADNGDIVWEHPRAMTISIETAEAYRRLLLPAQCVETLQTAMEKIPEAGKNALLMGVLARCYRDSGDAYRASRTLDFLVEQMEHKSTWLGRKQETTISLAAAEAALDNRQWSVASRWLARASDSGAGRVVTALKAYVDGEAALKAGDHKEAVDNLLAAFANRKYLSALRRDSICLRVAMVAADAGRLVEAERTLRVLMEETQSADVESEVAYRLAGVLGARGDEQRAIALLAEVSAGSPEGTYGMLAKEMKERIEFRQRHGSTLRTAGLLGPHRDDGQGGRRVPAEQ